MRAFLLPAIHALLAAVLVVLGPSTARAEEPMRSEDARLADVKLDVGLGVQAYGANADVDSGAAVEPYLRSHFSFADPDHGARRGLAVYDDLWLEIGGIGARNAGGFAIAGAGFALLPGFRSDYVGVFFGPSARAEAWMGGGKHDTHAFSTTSIPFEARLELFDSPFAELPRVILTGWYAPWPYQHHAFGGRLDVMLDAKDPSWVFLSLDRSEGIQYDKQGGDSWASEHGPAWDVRLGISVGFE